MAKTYPQPEPVLQPLQVANAEQHSSDRVAGRAREIVEVRPPRGTTPGGVAGNAVDREFFPLVSAAHEFKTPLVVMLGYAELLCGGHLGSVNELQRQVLGEIQESANRLQKLIQDLLLLYELRSMNGVSVRKQEPEATEVNEHLREIFNYWAPAATRKPINYQFEAAAGSPRVGMESLRLQHIVSNLIENALKFTPAQGQVTLSASQCFWDRRKAQTQFLFEGERRVNRKIENAVRIDVSDTGPGIPLDHHEDIFGDFVQLPGASSRGTGLGLAIARRLTETNGGAIWVESERGKGSRFSLLLALCKNGSGDR